jgi:hypothetical protein
MVRFEEQSDEPDHVLQIMLITVDQMGAICMSNGEIGFLRYMVSGDDFLHELKLTHAPLC